MDRNDRPRRWGNCPFQQGWIQGVGPLLDIHKDWRGVSEAYGFGRGHESTGHGDYLVPVAYSQGQQDQPERFRTAANPDGELGFAEGGKILFERGDERTASKGVALNDLLDGGVDLLSQRLMLGPEI